MEEKMLKRYFNAWKNHLVILLFSLFALFCGPFVWPENNRQGLLAENYKLDFVKSIGECSMSQTRSSMDFRSFARSICSSVSPSILVCCRNMSPQSLKRYSILILNTLESPRNISGPGLAFPVSTLERYPCVIPRDLANSRC